MQNRVGNLGDEVVAIAQGISVFGVS
jgi:hypothetical protein